VVHQLVGDLHLRGQRDGRGRTEAHHLDIGLLVEIGARSPVQRAHYPRSSGRPWSQAPLVTVSGTAAPVQLPGTPYAYAVASFPVTESSSAERLVRIDLADGRVTTGPAVASGSFLLSVGRSVALFSPAAIPRERARPVPNTPSRTRVVHDARARRRCTGTVLGYQTTLVNPALANHGLWYQVGSGKEIALVDTLTGTVLRSMRFSSTVMSVVSSPGGRSTSTSPSTGQTSEPSLRRGRSSSKSSMLVPKGSRRQYIDGNSRVWRPRCLAESGWQTAEAWSGRSSSTSLRSFRRW